MQKEKIISTLNQKFQDNIRAAIVLKNSESMIEIIEKEKHLAKAESFAYSIYLQTLDSSEYFDNTTKIQQLK